MKILANGREITISDASWKMFSYFWRRMEDGSWEPHTLKILERFLTRDTVFIDCGAWIGPTSLYAAQLCNLVHAYEVDPIAFESLVSNLEAGGIKNIFPRQVAILDYNGEASFGNGQMGDSMTYRNCPQDPFTVPCRTLRSVFDEHRLDGHAFIKMDIEGSEELVLKDVDLFAEHRPALYLSIHRGKFEHVEATIALIARIGEIYKYRYNADLKPMDLNDLQNPVLFTDEAA